MPTSPAKKPPHDPRSYEGVYFDEDGQRQDADIHNPILDAGDHAAAIGVSRALAAELELTAEEMAALGLAEPPEGG